MNGAIYLIVGLLFGVLAGIALGIRHGQRMGSLQSDSKIAELESALTGEKSKSELLAQQLADARAEENRITALNESLKAVTAGMSSLATQTQEAELKRVQADATMRQQIENMKLGNETLLRETTKLAGALSNSQTRGKYGETQLEMLLENAGLIEGVHFSKQDYRTTGTEISKPDIKISVPGGSEIFIDSKFPFERFLEAVVATDPAERERLMKAHSKDLLGHVTALAKRGYSDTPNSPDYVVLFAPFESILSEALDVEPTLLQQAFAKNVTIATPTTMLALLRTVAFVFNRSDLAKNAVEITELAGELLKRIGTVHSKISTLGDRIKSTERAYNDLIKSAEEHILKPARKMVIKGAPSVNKLKAIEGVDDEVREIKIKELTSPDLFAGEDLEDDGESGRDDDSN
jgi:DNA recombination protein RmuC